MTNFKHKEVWFVTGSQHLYGPKTLAQVDADSSAIVDGFNKSGKFPVTIVFKPVVKTPDEILDICIQASSDKNCIGLITWMHTFSPAKMWIGGLKALTKPYMHLHTQFNRDLPWSEIDMDYMNLHQSAHGERIDSAHDLRVGIRLKSHPSCIEQRRFQLAAGRVGAPDEVYLAVEVPSLGNIVDLRECGETRRAQ